MVKDEKYLIQPYQKVFSCSILVLIGNRFSAVIQSNSKDLGVKSVGFFSSNVFCSILFPYSSLSLLFE